MNMDIILSNEERVKNNANFIEKLKELLVRPDTNIEDVTYNHVLTPADDLLIEEIVITKKPKETKIEEIVVTNESETIKVNIRHLSMIGILKTVSDKL